MPVAWEFELINPLNPQDYIWSDGGPGCTPGCPASFIHSGNVAANGTFGTWEIVPSATPLPAALPLFATGLGALGLLGWRRKKKAAALAA